MRWPRRAMAFTALGGVLLAGWIVARATIWPDTHGASTSHFSIDSRYVHRKLGVTGIEPKGGETAPGAFANARDFARNDIVGTAQRRPGLFVGPRVWLDAGKSDPFQPGDRAFVHALRQAHAPIRTHLDWPGGHDHSYWQRHW